MSLGDFVLGATFDKKFTTVTSTGAPTTLAGTPVISIYKDNNTTEITAGITLTADFDSRTGMNNVNVVASGGNGFAVGVNYQIVITTGTVNSVSVVGYVVDDFSIQNRFTNVAQIGGQTASASGTITFPAATLASTTNITAGTITTVTTVTNQLAASAIATAVWQDTTSGDFTVASSIGKSLFTSGVVPGGTGGLFIAGTNAATTITTSLTTTFTGNLTGSVASVSGSVGSVVGAVGSVTGSVGSVVGAVGSVTARVTANTDQLAGQTVSAAAGVTFPTSVASPTNITAGTITTATNLTNAPTNGDLTATMKTSVTTAATAATPTVAGVSGVTFPATVASPTNITAGTITTVTNLTNAPTVGDFTATMKTSIGTSVAGSAVASVTGNVGGSVLGSVAGSVGSVTGAVGSVTAAVTITGDLSATMKASVTTAATAATPALSSAGTAAVADRLLARNQQGGADSSPTVSAALAGGLMKIDITAGVLTVKNGDGTTAYTRTLTRAALDAIIDSV